MKKTFKKVKEKTPELQNCYDKGYDAGYFGAMANNCHFSLFSTPEKTKAWERGNDAGSNQREVEKAKSKSKAKKPRV